MIIAYLSIGFVGWCVFYGINVRTYRFDAAPEDFFLGLVMTTLFWPAMVVGVVAMLFTLALYVLIMPRHDEH